MPRAIVIAAVVCLAACHAGGSPRALESASGAPGEAGAPNLDPHAPIPADPAALAADLATTTTRLMSAIDAWAAGGTPASFPPPIVQLLALHEQRIYGLLAGSPRLARSSLDLLTGEIAKQALANVTAGAALRSGITPSKEAPSFSTGPPDSPATLLGFYREAQARFGVAWQVLAAVNFVETRFGRIRSASYASARGPMQFIPSTWEAYGLGGNVHDPHDAILGAANYLWAWGAPRDYREALYHYNPLRSYVQAVRLYARQMMLDPKNFLVYWNWQAFAVTTKGDVQLTGPGATG